jgi:hypothetical protein
MLDVSKKSYKNEENGAESYQLNGCLEEGGGGILVNG